MSPIRNGITYANKGNIENVDSPIISTLNGKIVLNTVQSFFSGRLLLKCRDGGAGGAGGALAPPLFSQKIFIN